MKRKKGFTPADWDRLSCLFGWKTQKFLPAVTPAKTNNNLQDKVEALEMQVDILIDHIKEMKK